MIRQNRLKDSARNLDTGLAMVLLSLIFYSKTRLSEALLLTVILLLVCMIYSRLFRFIVPLWMGIGEYLGMISSFILLSSVYILVVTPMGFWARVGKHDPFRLHKFKKDQNSVFHVRDHEFTAADLENAF